MLDRPYNALAHLSLLVMSRTMFLLATTCRRVAVSLLVILCFKPNDVSAVWFGLETGPSSCVSMSPTESSRRQLPLRDSLP
jgi:hypothetical protein